MEIRERQSGEATVIELAGRLTVNDQPGVLKDAVADVVRRGARDVLLDLSGVRYIDSTRLGELIAAHVTVSRLGGRLKLVATPPRVLELLTMAGLDGVFERYASAEDAARQPR
jgi:anti-sigma B factor antagonist